MDERLNLLHLYRDCEKQAQRIVEILGEPMHSEAKALLRSGFMVPDPEAFVHPKTVFQNIQKIKPGLTQPTEYNDVSLGRRLDFICALAGSVESFSSEYDLAWSNAWHAYMQGEGKKTIESARHILHLWNFGGKSELINQLRIDCEEDYDNWASSSVLKDYT
jgi:hypothetical protein